MTVVGKCLTALELAAEYLNGLDYVKIDDWLTGNQEIQWVSSDGVVLATAQYAGSNAQILFHVPLEGNIWQIIDGAVQLLNCGRNPWIGPVKIYHQQFVVLVGPPAGELYRWKGTDVYRADVLTSDCVTISIAAGFVANHPGAAAVIVDCEALEMSRQDLSLFRSQLAGLGFEGPICAISDGTHEIGLHLKDLLEQAA